MSKTFVLLRLCHIFMPYKLYCYCMVFCHNLYVNSLVTARSRSASVMALLSIASLKSVTNDNKYSTAILEHGMDKMNHSRDHILHVIQLLLCQHCLMCTWNYNSIKFTIILVTHWCVLKMSLMAPQSLTYACIEHSALFNINICAITTYNITFKSPLFPGYGAQQETVSTAGYSINSIVTAHDTSCSSFPYTCFKCWQVSLWSNNWIICIWNTTNLY